MCPAAGRTRAAGVRAAEVVGDSVYGHASQLRQWLESQAQAYVLAVPGHEYVGVGRRQVQVQDIQACRPAAEWQPWGRYLLCRRSREDPARPQAYLVLAPPGCPLQTLVQVAGTRGCIENSLRPPKGKWGWMRTKCAAPRAGTGTSPSPCISFGCTSSPPRTTAWPGWIGRGPTNGWPSCATTCGVPNVRVYNCSTKPVAKGTPAFCSPNSVPVSVVPVFLARLYPIHLSQTPLYGKAT